MYVVREAGQGRSDEVGKPLVRFEEALKQYLGTRAGSGVSGQVSVLVSRTSLIAGVPRTIETCVKGCYWQDVEAVSGNVPEVASRGKGGRKD